MRPRFLALSITLAAACTGATPPSPAELITPQGTAALLSQLAADSLRGRMTGSPGAAQAAAIIAGAMREAGLEPAGDSGYFQRVPFLVEGDAGRLRLRVAPDWAAFEAATAERRRAGPNVLGILRGSDPGAGHVLVDAHYDHIGAAGDPLTFCRAVGADSICNGADDDASGVVAVLEIARALSRGPRPRRTILFAAMVGEEEGALGAEWYIGHPALPMGAMVANLEIEMIGRPDSLAGGPGRAWLTGYERSTMGDALAAQGIPLVADPRPAESFFQRSDNYALALRGIVAHTLASFNLHQDYHQPSDEAAKADPAHMAAVIIAAARAVLLLADGPAPAWKPGGRPVPGR